MSDFSFSATPGDKDDENENDPPEDLSEEEEEVEEVCGLCGGSGVIDLDAYEDGEKIDDWHKPCPDCSDK